MDVICLIHRQAWSITLSITLLRFTAARAGACCRTNPWDPRNLSKWRTAGEAWKKIICVLDYSWCCFSDTKLIYTEMVPVATPPATNRFSAALGINEVNYSIILLTQTRFCLMYAVGGDAAWRLAALQVPASGSEAWSAPRRSWGPWNR